jgi:hypothetical protein
MTNPISLDAASNQPPGSMAPIFFPISYASLNSRQKENFNYQKLSAVLADFGYVTHRLSDDWQGADFIAQHISGDRFLKVQLKSRLSFDRKYQGKEIWIAFPDSNGWYLFPHDEILKAVLNDSNIANTSSWADKGIYNFPVIPSGIRKKILPYRLP